MSENETEQYNDDEYHFIDEPEAPFSEEIEPEEPIVEKPKPKFEMTNFLDFFKQSSPARNALVVLAFAIFLYFLYTLTSHLLTTGKHEKVANTDTSSQQAIPALTVVKSSAPQLSQEMADIETNVQQKLSSVEQGQASMQTQIASMNTQISSLSANLNILTEKMTQLNQQIAQLATTVQDQSHVIVALNERTKPKPKIIKRITVNNSSTSLKYYMQAVIPGRAWLIANNGSTITVREGTPIPGYGIAKIIDPIQGRVMTSSGKEIRFSHDDS